MLPLALAEERLHHAVAAGAGILIVRRWTVVTEAMVDGHCDNLALRADKRLLAPAAGFTGVRAAGQGEERRADECEKSE